MITIIYTDTDKIRSALGVDDEDIGDAQITDRNLDKELRLDLVSWLPTHAALYTSGTSVSATDSEQMTSDALVLYSTYFCAVLMVSALRLAAPQQVSDGKNSLTRFPTIDWQRLDSDLRAGMARAKAAILKLQSQASTETDVVLFAAVGLASDPVTTTPT